MQRRVPRSLAAVGWLVAVAPVAVLPGQAVPGADTAHTRAPLFTWRDAALGGGFAALTAAMFPIDRSLATRLQDSSAQSHRTLKKASVDIEYAADPGAVVIGVSLYGIGRLAGWGNVAALGLHETEAVAVSGAIETLLKGVAGRARPYLSDTTPDRFRFGRGFGNAAYQSFPSGHTTVAFAAAAVVSGEAQRWWPRGTWLVAPAAYGGATLVGLARMYNNAHWASDVALGAAIGTFTGLKVVRYAYAHPRNAVDRALLDAEVGPDPGRGVRVGWTVMR